MEAYIAGVSSPTDFRGKSCVYVFFGGCDFQCPFCYAPEYVQFKNEFLVLLKDIKRQIFQFPVDWVIFSGGEPCLQRQALLELARYCQKAGIKVGIETNGSRPDAIGSLIREKLVNFIAIDLKVPLDSPAHFEAATMSRTFFRTTESIIKNINETLNLLKKTNAEIEARTTIVPTLVDGRKDILEIAKLVNEINAPWVLQRFRNHLPLINSAFNRIEEPPMKVMEDLREECLKKYPQMVIEIN